MDKDKLKERGRSLEEEYVRKEEAKLVEKLRERARLEEIAAALARTLQVENPDLLNRIIALGVTLDTGAAFLLAPLVQVAWAEGSVTERERDIVLQLAGARGVAEGSAAYAALQEWLRARPSNEFFDTAFEAIKAGLAVLSPEERAARVKGIVDACRQVAGASGGLFKRLGLGAGISGEEESLLDSIATLLRAR